MVFELSDDLATCPPSNIEALTVALNNLLIGYYEGNLSLMASSALCRFFHDKKLVEGVRQSIALNHLLNNNGYHPDVLWHIKVVVENANPEKHELDISFFAKTESIQPTSLLCENLEDTKFYLKLSEMFRPDNPMVAVGRNGGGGTTADVFRAIQRRNVVCLAILDSDVKYPDCEQGNTARRCVNSLQKKYANLEVKVLPVHEAENLVPVSFMLQKACAEGVVFLKRLLKKSRLDQLVFYDVKEGITKEKANEHMKYKDFAETLFRITNPRNPNGFEAFFALKKESDNLFPELHPDMLSLFVADKSPQYQSDDLDSYRKEIADLVYTYLCCRGTDPIH